MIIIIKKGHHDYARTHEKRKKTQFSFHLSKKKSSSQKKLEALS